MVSNESHIDMHYIMNGTEKQLQMAFNSLFPCLAFSTFSILINKNL